MADTAKPGMFFIAPTTELADEIRDWIDEQNRSERRYRKVHQRTTRRLSAFEEKFSKIVRQMREEGNLYHETVSPQCRAGCIFRIKHIGRGQIVIKSAFNRDELSD